MWRADTYLGERIRADLCIVLDQCKQIVCEKLRFGVGPVNPTQAEKQQMR